MGFRLDHVVIAVHDLDLATRDYRALGFTVQPGGRHPGRTSRNALVVFQDGAYLELIAWPEPGPAERWYGVLSAHGEGLMDFALIAGDTPGAIAGAKARGLAFNGPLEGGRERPDGAQVHWVTGRQTTWDLPFFCGDITPRSLRVPEGDVRRHDNGVLGVASVTVAVRDLATSRARYRQLLGEGVAIGPAFALPEAGLALSAVAVPGTPVVLATPLGPPRPDEPDFARRMRVRLSTRGEGAFAITLRLPPGSAPTRFDGALSHAVPMDGGDWPA